MKQDIKSRKTEVGQILSQIKEPRTIIKTDNKIRIILKETLTELGSGLYSITFAKILIFSPITQCKAVDVVDL